MWIPVKSEMGAILLNLCCFFLLLFFLNQRILFCLEITPATLFAPSFCLVRFVSIRIIGGDSGWANRVRAREGKPRLLSVSKKQLPNWSLGDAAKCRAPLTNPAGKARYTATRNASASLPWGLSDPAPGAGGGRQGGCWPSWSPAPDIYEGPIPDSSPPCPGLPPLYEAAVGEAFSANRCLLENLKLWVGGQILTVLWIMSALIIMQSFTYILDINIVLKYSRVLNAIYMLRFFPLLLFYLLQLTECLHITLINIFIGEGFAIFS